MAKLTKRDLKMLKLACEMELPLVADRLKISLNIIYQRFYWLRKKRKEAQYLVNMLNNAERRCPKLRKLLTTTELKRAENT